MALKRAMLTMFGMAVLMGGFSTANAQDHHHHRHCYYHHHHRICR